MKATWTRHRDCDGFHPKVLYKRNERRNRGVLGQGGAERKMTATSRHNDVILDTEECYE